MYLRTRVSYNPCFFQGCGKYHNKTLSGQAFMKPPKSKLTDLMLLDLLHIAENLKLH